MVLGRMGMKSTHLRSSGFCQKMQLHGCRQKVGQLGAWRVRLLEEVCRGGTIRKNYVSRLSDMRVR